MYAPAHAPCVRPGMLTPPTKPHCPAQVALEKTRGNLPGAVDLLRKYLDVWCNDREAWEELGELYLEVREQGSQKMHILMCSFRFLQSRKSQVHALGGGHAVAALNARGRRTTQGQHIMHAPAWDHVGVQPHRTCCLPWLATSCFASEYNVSQAEPWQLDF